MTKAARNSNPNCLAINMSNFFIRNMFQPAKLYKKHELHEFYELLFVKSLQFVSFVFQKKIRKSEAADAVQAFQIVVPDAT